MDDADLDDTDPHERADAAAGSPPLVSVVTPCYNHEPYIDDYARSLLAQSHRPIELIVVDDHSSDGSWERLQQHREALENALDRVVMVRNHTNQGLFATLDRATSLVDGDLLCILESDDLYYPSMIEECASFLAHNPRFGAVHGDVDVLAPDGSLTPRRWTGSPYGALPPGDVYEALLWENRILTCSFCCRTRLFQEHVDLRAYAARGYRTADYPMFLDLARRTQFGFIDHSLAVYRVVRGSVSHPAGRGESFRWKQAYYRVKLDFIERHGADERTQARAFRQYHKALFEGGYVLGDPEMCREGFDWLAANDPRRYRRLTERLRLLSCRVPALHAVLSRIDPLFQDPLERSEAPTAT